MSGSVNEVLAWTDNEFKKTVNVNKFIDNNREMMKSKVVVRECEYCGEKFAIYVDKKGRPPKYCSDKCREYANLEQSRVRWNRWYHKHKHELSEKQRWHLGSGTLGQHRNKDFNQEHKTITKEMARLRIKKTI